MGNSCTCIKEDKDNEIESINLKGSKIDRIVMI
jgi:hypothetical protein